MLANVFTLFTWLFINCQHLHASPVQEWFSKWIEYSTSICQFSWGSGEQNYTRSFIASDEVCVSEYRLEKINYFCGLKGCVCVYGNEGNGEHLHLSLNLRARVTVTMMFIHLFKAHLMCFYSMAGITLFLFSDMSSILVVIIQQNQININIIYLSQHV